MDITVKSVADLSLGLNTPSNPELVGSFGLIDSAAIELFPVNIDTVSLMHTEPEVVGMRGIIDAAVLELLTINTGTIALEI